MPYKQTRIYMQRGDRQSRQRVQTVSVNRRQQQRIVRMFDLVLINYLGVAVRIVNSSKYNSSLLLITYNLILKSYCR